MRRIGVLLACCLPVALAVPASAHAGCSGGLVVAPVHLADPTGLAQGWDTRPTYDVAVVADQTFVERWGGDGDWRADATRLMGEADAIFDQIAVDVVVVDLHADEIPEGDGAERLEAVRFHLLAAHPDLARDAVLLLVHDDIGAYGYSACIGSAGSSPRAMAVVSTAWAHVASDFPAEDVPKVIAHELGHLLGGQHHYGNCVEGDASDSEAPCTLMTPYLAGRQMGTLEALTMRGWAEAHL